MSPLHTEPSFFATCVGAGDNHTHQLQAPAVKCLKVLWFFKFSYPFLPEGDHNGITYTINLIKTQVFYGISDLTPFLSFSCRSPPHPLSSYFFVFSSYKNTYKRRMTMAASQKKPGNQQCCSNSVSIEYMCLQSSRLLAISLRVPKKHMC